MVWNLLIIREIFKGDHNAAAVAVAARKLRWKQISALSGTLNYSLENRNIYTLHTWYSDSVSNYHSQEQWPDSQALSSPGDNIHKTLSMKGMSWESGELTLNVNLNIASRVNIKCNVADTFIEHLCHMLKNTDFLKQGPGITKGLKQKIVITLREKS